MNVLDDKTRLLNRLRRVEGQIRGLARMIEMERDCQDILTQLSSARSALSAAGDAILENYLHACSKDLAALDSEKLVAAVRLARG